MPKADMTLQQEHFLKEFGNELRRYRDLADRSQGSIGNILGWNRDAIAKVENGRNNISVYDYLCIVRELREYMPADHPGVLLAERFNRSLS